MAYDFDLLVLGGGAAGLTAAGIGVNLGAKTCMVERARLGGDCTWTGCVPSKTLLKTAKVAHQMRHAERYGLAASAPSVDFPAVMRHVHAVREEIYEDADAPENFEAMGVDVRAGRARFVDAHTVEIEREDGGAERISGRKIVIATGGRPRVPAIDGLEDAPYHTSETLFEITEQPRHLAVLGAGPIGTEMAQAFRRLGSEVTVVDRAHRILGKDDAELAGMLHEVLAGEGVRYRFGASVERVERDGAGVRLTVRAGGGTETIAADALLVAVGRVPNVEGLGLEAAGIAYTERGVTADDRGRTNVKHVYAAGDVTGRFQFTHMSEHTAKVAATHALLHVPMKIDAGHLPWCTYTDPELAHVGATAEALDERGTRYDVYRFPYARVDRAVTEGEATGLIKVYAKRLTGRILGASILGTAAGDLIGEYALAMRNGVTLRQISDTIHPYPTYGLGVRRAADQWYARKQSATFTRLLQRVFGYRGPVIDPDPDRIV